MLNINKSGNVSFKIPPFVAGMVLFFFIVWGLFLITTPVLFIQSLWENNLFWSLFTGLGLLFSYLLLFRCVKRK